MTDNKRDRGDGRDKKGRWVNVSGNPSGRPKNIPDLDMADIRNFSMKTINIKIGGEEQVVTHHEALVHALFQTAMQGRITAQLYLLGRAMKSMRMHWRLIPTRFPTTLYDLCVWWRLPPIGPGLKSA